MNKLNVIWKHLGSVSFKIISALPIIIFVIYKAILSNQILLLMFKATSKTVY